MLKIPTVIPIILPIMLFIATPARADDGKLERKVAELEARLAKVERLLDEKFADDAIIEFLDIQADTVKVRKKYWKKFRRIIPATKAARFYQLENKMDSEIDFVMAGGTPLIESK